MLTGKLVGFGAHTRTYQARHVVRGLGLGFRVLGSTDSYVYVRECAWRVVKGGAPKP